MIPENMNIVVAVTFLWIGFVCAISFIEAWLKFRAPGITLPLGLGIGRIVFRALNKVEWVFAIVMCVTIGLSDHQVFSAENLFLLIPLVVLIMQTTWLLPALDYRAEMHIEGHHVPPSNLHFYYVGFEFLKIGCLFIFGSSLLSNI